jgi:hypothetical protein
VKFVMTQSVCFEALEMLGGKAEVYVADNGDPVKVPSGARAGTGPAASPAR